jgi:hypothetical protein
MYSNTTDAAGKSTVAAIKNYNNEPVVKLWCCVIATPLGLPLYKNRE